MISTTGYLIAEIQGGPDRPWALAGWLAGRGWYVRIMWTRDNRPLIATRMLIFVFFMMLMTPMSLNMMTGATWFSWNLNNVCAGWFQNNTFINLNFDDIVDAHDTEYLCCHLVPWFETQLIIYPTRQYLY